MTDKQTRTMTTVDRRAFMRGAVYLVGGAAALTQLSACGSEADIVVPVLGEPGRFFDAEQMTLLHDIVDIIIPATDTPGAADVGVHGLIDSMMVDWASADTQAQFTGVLDGVDALAETDFGGSFLTLTAEQKFAVVRDYDANHLAAEDRSYARFKELTLLGYYHSEIGATQELRYELVPGEWRACISFSEIGRAWAA